MLINDIAGISILSEDWMTAHNALEPADPTWGKRRSRRWAEQVRTQCGWHQSASVPVQAVAPEPNVEPPISVRPELITSTPIKHVASFAKAMADALRPPAVGAGASSHAGHTGSTP